MMKNALAVLAAIALGYFAVDSYLSTRARVKTLTAENKTLADSLNASRRQHNAEAAVGQQGLTYSQQGTAKQEKTQIEIRQQIIREPCAVQSVPDAGAQRLWQLAEATRAASVSGSPSEPDRLQARTAAGKSPRSAGVGRVGDVERGAAGGDTPGELR